MWKYDTTMYDAFYDFIDVKFHGMYNSGFFLWFELKTNNNKTKLKKQKWNWAKKKQELVKNRFGCKLIN